ncbi:hypothetical protein GCM10023350_22790 [Nocardioides endophyticus]|uniref:Amidase domain-containing protein n=1 Tax=Nocardioides endophyticus TaxID=1353775 RepID=A0ABP8YUS0_9ACTN
MDLHYRSASDLIAALRAGTLRSVELLDALLARIDEVDDGINAFVTIDRDGARSAADDGGRTVLRRPRAPAMPPWRDCARPAR